VKVSNELEKICKEALGSFERFQKTDRPSKIFQKIEKNPPLVSKSFKSFF
jgi:hypothetical protein